MEKCCSECSEPRVGHSLCTHCNKWLCFQCTELHLHERTSTSTQPPEHHLHQRASSSNSPQAQPDTGSSCCERAVVMCPLHKQETLELLCETCDLMTCSICHLSAHKDHRLVHVGKALQDQRWLLENLMARVEEKRSAVENTAKQIQGRLHGVKITQRKAENQIKMAKMIMMNELNKRTKLLIEQLENVSSSFKQHLEDQLQGAIELCSQLEHVQNFITWAVAHHRRNPLLFSKELIALQMQQLLEPLQFSDTWAPLKVKFNWDASFWTKQISTLGQLSVEGGGRPYSEGTGHSSILRPQPVTCRAVPSLCHSVREADCAYQAFCQPQLCCLHCRAAQSVPLDKYQCPPQPGCSSPPGLQRRWEPGGNAMPPQSMLRSSQLPSSPAGPRQQTAPRSPPTATPMSTPTPTVTPTPQCEFLQAATDQAAASCRAPGYGQRVQRAATPTPAAAPTVTPTPATAQETLLRGRQQAAELPGQQCVGSGPTPANAQPYLTASQNEGVTSPHSEMNTAARACGAGERSRPSPEDRVQSHGSPEEGARSHGSPEQVRLIQNDKPAGDGCSLAAETGEQEHAAQQDCGRDRCARPASAGAPGQTQKPPPTALTTYKTEPDNVYTYTDNAGFKTSTKSRLSREVQDSSREVNEASKVPVVCLERLKILVSKPPAPGGPSDDLTDPGLKAEGSIMVALDREITTEGVSSEEVEVCLLPGEAPQLQELCGSGKELQEQAAPNTPPAPSTEPPPHTDYEGEPASHQTEQDLSEPLSGRASDSLLESATEADLGSEAEVGSELQAESDRSLESEPRGESDSDSELESEQPPDSELLAESERELVSDPDSTAEVSLNLDQEGDWEGGPGAESESRAGPSTAAPPPEGPVEMENEDFCAVCLIGGDLLCCDRCPKVFHLACHVPSLLSFPTGDWVCTLCRDVNWPEVEYDSEDTCLPTDAAPSGLSACDQRKCEKLILDIYCNILSAPFHEPVSPLARHYYQIIRRPMDLSVIRGRLRRSSSSHYTCVQELVDDILLMFKNCAKFNYPDSEVAQAGRSLQVFFSTRLGEVFPDLPRPAPQDDSDSEDNEEAVWAPGAFPWPERRDQSHRKRKRRHSLNWRRLHY